MNKKSWWIIFSFCFAFLPARASAQCKDRSDQTCWNLQYILYAAETDFRPFQENKPLKPRDPKIAPANPDLSVGAAKVPCHVDTWWSSVVSMYICSAELSAADADQWYAKTVSNLHQLQYLWQFKTDSPGADRYLDAGPSGCDVAPLDQTVGPGPYGAAGPYLASGPYLGQCPLHLHVIQNAGGTARVTFWLNSYTSANLVRNPDSRPQIFARTAKPTAPPSNPAAQAAASAANSSPRPADNSAGVASTNPQAANSTGASANPPTASQPDTASSPSAANEPSPPANQPAPAVNAGGCDELCRGLKQALNERVSAFRAFSSRSANTQSPAGASTTAAVKLFGASTCSIKNTPFGDVQSSAANLSASQVHWTSVSAKGSTAKSTQSPARPAAQYVCYWPRDSEAAAQSQFRDLVSRLEVLMPANWSARERNDAEELSGAPITVWSARDPRNQATLGLYLSGKSVGLHISADH